MKGMNFIPIRQSIYSIKTLRIQRIKRLQLPLLSFVGSGKRKQIRRCIDRWQRWLDAAAACCATAHGHCWAVESSCWKHGTMWRFWLDVIYYKASLTLYICTGNCLDTLTQGDLSACRLDFVDFFRNSECLICNSKRRQWNIKTTAAKYRI